MTSASAVMNKVHDLQEAQDRYNRLTSWEPDLSEALYYPLAAAVKSTFDPANIAGVSSSILKEALEGAQWLESFVYDRKVPYEVSHPKSIYAHSKRASDYYTNLAHERREAFMKEPDFARYFNWKAQQPLDEWGKTLDPLQLTNAASSALASYGIGTLGGGISALATFGVTRNPAAALRAFGTGFGFSAAGMEMSSEFGDTYDYYVRPIDEGGLGMSSDDAIDVAVKTSLVYGVASYFLEKGPVQGILNRYSKSVYGKGLNDTTKKALWRSTNRKVLASFNDVKKKYTPDVFTKMNQSYAGRQWKDKVWDPMIVSAASEGATEGMQYVANTLVSATFKDTPEESTFIERLSKFHDSQELIENIYGGVIGGGAMGGAARFGVQPIAQRMQGTKTTLDDVKEAISDLDTKVVDDDVEVSTSADINLNDGGADYVSKLIKGERQRVDISTEFDNVATSDQKNSPLGKEILSHRGLSLPEKLFNIWKMNDKSFDFAKNLTDQEQQIVKAAIANQAKQNSLETGTKGFNISSKVQNNLNKVFSIVDNETIVEAVEKGDIKIIMDKLVDKEGKRIWVDKPTYKALVNMVKEGGSDAQFDKKREIEFENYRKQQEKEAADKEGEAFKVSLRKSMDEIYEGDMSFSSAVVQELESPDNPIGIKEKIIEVLTNDEKVKIKDYLDRHPSIKSIKPTYDKDGNLSGIALTETLDDNAIVTDPETEHLADEMKTESKDEVTEEELEVKRSVDESMDSIKDEMNKVNNFDLQSDNTLPSHKQEPFTINKTPKGYDVYTILVDDGKKVNVLGKMITINFDNSSVPFILHKAPTDFNSSALDNHKNGKRWVVSDLGTGGEIMSNSTQKRL